MKRALILLVVVGLYGTAYGETYHWVDSRGIIHYTHNSAAVPQQYRHQLDHRGGAIKDPVVRASLERESRRALAMREEALKMARERVLREAEEARQKGLAAQKPSLEKETAREAAVRKSSGKGVAAPGKKAPARRVAGK